MNTRIDRSLSTGAAALIGLTWIVGGALALFLTSPANAQDFPPLEKGDVALIGAYACADAATVIKSAELSDKAEAAGVPAQMAAALQAGLGCPATRTRAAYVGVVEEFADQPRVKPDGPAFYVAEWRQLDNGRSFFGYFLGAQLADAPPPGNQESERPSTPQFYPLPAPRAAPYDFRAGFLAFA